LIKQYFIIINIVIIIYKITSENNLLYFNIYIYKINNKLKKFQHLLNFYSLSIYIKKTMNKYEILKKLGDGTYGDVFKARNKINNQIVAIKIMKKDNIRKVEDILRNR